MLADREKEPQNKQQLEEERIKQERLGDILVLLQNLIEREETTIKMILDCLYDIGCINIINQKFPLRPIGKIVKSIARASKPVFKSYAWRKFKKESPQALTDFLNSKVNF
jgi:hypothetical protein